MRDRRVVIVYVVGRYSNCAAQRWAIKGIFTSKQDAEAICKGEGYFIGPIALNTPVVAGGWHVLWPGSYDFNMEEPTDATI